MGIHLRVLSDSYPMNTNMTGFRWFSNTSASLCFDENSLGNIRVIIHVSDFRLILRGSFTSLTFSVSTVGGSSYMFNPFTLGVPLESIVCYSHTFENNFGIEHKFTKYLKESCCLVSD